VYLDNCDYVTSKRASGFKTLPHRLVDGDAAAFEIMDIEAFAELYHATWKKGNDIRQHIIYDITVTSTVYNSLQKQLTDAYPERFSSDYEPHTTSPMKLKSAALSMLRSQRTANTTSEEDSGATPLPVTVSVLDLQPLNLLRTPFGETMILPRTEYREKLDILKALRWSNGNRNHHR
jgi:hypothetical protein